MVMTTYGYTNPDDTHTSAQIRTLTNAVGTSYDKTYTYTYDANGNILSIGDGTNTTSYVYDGLNQLTRENNQAAGKTWTYTYDAGGNITEKREFAYTTGSLEGITPIDTIAYGYTAEDWPDLLTSYDGQQIASDSIGNMLNDGTWSYTWQHGRQLASMTNAATQLEFEYNADGLRTSKTLSNETVSDQTTLFHYNGTQLTHMTGGGDTLHFYYDANGKRTSLDYNGATYAYLYNAQGDVVALSDTNGTVVVEYAYDAWGNPLSVTGTGSSTIGQKNPFRYRGYFYDTETGLYYLQSRYYSPKLGRFICADDAIGANKDLIGNNVFAYGSNNPICNLDEDGHAILGFAIGFAIKTFRLSIRMLGRSILGRGKNHTYGPKSLVARRLAGSKVMQNEIQTQIRIYSKNGYTGTKTSSGSVYLSSNDSLNDLDLKYSVGKTNYVMSITEVTQTTGIGMFQETRDYYKVDITNTDTYNFDEYRAWNSLSNYMNNFGYWAQQNGLIKEYYWDVSYTVYVPDNRRR